MTTNIIVVEKGGTLKSTGMKNFSETELYKKCGFKNSDGFICHAEWKVKLQGQKYLVKAYGKLEGKANMENKYDFPPPIDKKLFFGACALVGYVRDDNDNKSLIHLTIDLWNKIYEKLFGGFEDLTTFNDDDDESDELDKIPNKKKTKVGGYLKDGFVVDDDDDECNYNDDDGDSYETVSEEQSGNNDDDDDEIDVGSELSEDSYIE